MVLFQNRIIYMPGVPLGAKRERIQDYKHSFFGIDWKEHRRSIKTSDGKLLSYVVGKSKQKEEEDGGVVVVYFQGYLSHFRLPLPQAPFHEFMSLRCKLRTNLIPHNTNKPDLKRNASSTPPRLPGLSSLLSALRFSSTTYTFLVPSYRGYWSSTGRPSQRGITRDCAAIFSHLHASYPPRTRFVLWGHSIGCGIAMAAWADYLKSGGAGKRDVVGIVLETPFVSVDRMLRAIYPQRWLPYRYLSPFLTSHWDMASAAEVVRASGTKAKMLVLRAQRDEIVPEEEAVAAERILEDMVDGCGIRKVVIERALHEECGARAQGKQEILEFLRGLEDNRA